MTEQTDSQPEAMSQESELEAAHSMISELLVLLAITTLSDLDNRKLEPLALMTSRLIRPPTERALELAASIRDMIHSTRIQVLASLRAIPPNECGCAMCTGVRFAHGSLTESVLSEMAAVPREAYMPAVFEYEEADEETDHGHHDQETV